MGLFKPRTVTRPDGQVMTYAGARELERLELERQRQVAQLERQRLEQDVRARQLEVDQAVDTWTRSSTGDEDAPASTWDRITDPRFLIVAVIVAFCGFWEVTGQQMFFDAMKSWPADFEYAKTLAPFLVPVISLGFGLYAMVNAARGLPHQKQTAVMWISAVTATVMNTWHAHDLLKDWGFPLFVGAASIVSPLAFHWFVTQTKDEAGGKTAAQVAIAVANRLHHPWLSKHANELWAASLGTVSPAEAWLRVYLKAKGHLPGQDLEVAAPAQPVAAPQPQPAAVDEHQGDEQPAATQDAPTSATTTATTTATEDATEDATTDAAAGLVDELAAYLAKVADTATATGGSTATTTATATVDEQETPSSAAVAAPQPQPQPRPQPTSDERNRNRNRFGRRTATKDAQPAKPGELVERYVREQLAAGTPRGDLNATHAAAAAGCTRQAATKAITKALAKIDAEAGATATDTATDTQ